MPWDGLDNSGAFFPVGGPYAVRVTGHGGELHFPFLDVENDRAGGPALTLLNPPGSVCPPWHGGCHGAFYDDTGYVTDNGTPVQSPGVVLCGQAPPSPPQSDPLLGFDTTTAQRAFGLVTGGNTNFPCTGGFGDAKGLDLWTYYPGGQTAAELSIVRNQPSLATTATGPAGIIVGQTVSISDSAALTGFGGLQPADTVTFQLAGPATTVDGVVTCPGPPVIGPVSAPLDLSAGTATTTQSFTPVLAGDYYWIASFGGDANNSPAGPSGCGDPNELARVAKAAPTMTSVAAVATTTPIAGAPLTTTDRVQLTGFSHLQPSATATFTLVGPATGSPPSCAPPAATQIGPLVEPVDPATGTAQTGDQTFTPGAVGTYYWIASFSGDTNNQPAGPSGCGDPDEQVVAGPARVTVSTAAATSTPAPIAGQPVATADTASVHTQADLSGPSTITFWLVGPAVNIPPACPDVATALIGPVTAAVDPGTGRASTGPQTFAPSTPGDYYWIAEFSGDANNQPSGPDGCGDPAELVTVGRARPAITSQAGPNQGELGIAIHDTATVSGGLGPTGTVGFALYGPGDTSCASNLVAGDPTFAAVPLAGGQATSAAYTTLSPGTYRWVASYSGDAANAPVSGACGDPTEDVAVIAPAGPPPAETGAWEPLVMIAGLLALVLGAALLALARRRERGR